MTETLHTRIAADHHPHRQLAVDVWKMIRAMTTAEALLLVEDRDVGEFNEAAINLIEMACDSAAENERVRGRGPR